MSSTTRTVEISTGLFVLLGFASLFFMVTQITNRELTINGNGTYEVTAQFENIGSLKRWRVIVQDETALSFFERK